MDDPFHVDFRCYCIEMACHRKQAMDWVQVSLRGAVLSVRECVESQGSDSE